MRLQSTPAVHSTHRDMAKNMFSHSRKGEIKDYYNFQDGELGRSVCSFVCFSVACAGLSVICFDRVFVACGIVLCKLCQHWRSLSATLIECSNVHFAVVSFFRGASSVVKVARHKGTKKDYAIKIITKTVSETTKLPFSPCTF